METGDNMELSHAFFGAQGLVQDIIDAHLVRARLAPAPAERAELAAIHTDICGIDVHIPHEVHAFAVLFFGDVSGHASESEQVIGLEEFQAVLAREALIGSNFIIDLFDSHLFSVACIDFGFRFTVITISLLWFLL